MKTKTVIVSGLVVVVTAVVAVCGYNYFTQGDCEEADKNYRTDKDVWIKEKLDDPLDSGQIARFKGLDYYPVDCRYVFEGILDVDPEEIPVSTTDGNIIQMKRYGTVTVTIKSTNYILEIFEAGNLPEFKNFPGTYFIPFWDETAILPDTTTYEKGRYLIVDIPASGNQMSLDFNMATNSFEAYHYKYSSVVTPSRNILAAPLAIGERKYEDRTHQQ